MKRLLAFCLGAAFFAAGNGLCAVEYRFVNIADNTTPAPIGVFNDFGLPSISGDVVAFRAAYEGTSDTGSGIFTGSGQAVQTIVNQGDPAPSGVFITFSDPTISNSLVAFRAFYTGVFGETGVFVGSGGPLTLIASPG